MGGISFRRLDVNDIPEARDIAARFLRQAIVPDAHLRPMLADERNIVIVAERRASPVGFLVAYGFPGLSGARLVYLYDIAVAADYRREGVGRGMVALLKDICRQSRVDSIWVGSSLGNEAACGLWESTGARRVSDRYVEFIYELDDPRPPG